MSEQQREDLIEVELPRQHGAIPREVVDFAERALKRGKQIDCFDYVPSNYRSLFWALASMPCARYCEWGSGIGIGVGIAAMLGYRAEGIEISEPLAAASRSILEEERLPPNICTGSYHEIDCEPADIYFTYCWPGKVRATESHFVATAPDDARLLICHGADDIRCKVKRKD